MKIPFVTDLATLSLSIMENVIIQSAWYVYYIRIILTYELFIWTNPKITWILGNISRRRQDYKCHQWIIVFVIRMIHLGLSILSRIFRIQTHMWLKAYTRFNHFVYHLYDWTDVIPELTLIHCYNVTYMSILLILTVNCCLLFSGMCVRQALIHQNIKQCLPSSVHFTNVWYLD